MAKKQKNETKLSIIHCAMKLFLEKGYSDAYITTIAKQLKISTGNLTFYFPTKEHLLAEIVKELFAFQDEEGAGEIGPDAFSIVAYFRELIVIAAVCEDNPKVRDLVTAAYTHSMSLEVIRRNDCKKAVKRFGVYCEGWTPEDYVRAECIVSGIEYAMLMTEHTQDISMEQRVITALNAIMKIYQVPEQDGQKYVESVLAINYRDIGNRLFEDFCEYVEKRICI